MKVNSLKIKLFKSLILPITLLILIICTVSVLSSKDEVDEVYDSQLITAANVLSLVSNNGEITNDDVNAGSYESHLNKSDKKALHEYAKWRAFRIWNDGKLKIFTENARSQDIPPTTEGFSNFLLNGQHWRVFTMYIPEDKAIIEVAEKRAARIDIIRSLLFGIMGPILLTLPLIIILIWRGIKSSLGDLQQFATALHQRSDSDLSQMDNQNIPVEVLPVAEAVNLLLSKLESSLAQERLFIDNAAHELRTPLATLNIQTQVILNAKTEDEKNLNLQALSKGVGYASRLLDQLLIMARLRNQNVNLENLNFYEQTREIIAILSHEAIAKQIDLSLEGEENLQIISNKILFSVLISNLIENAIKYSPMKGIVQVTVKAQNNYKVLTIVDNGPGIPEEEYINVFKRFYRLAEKESGSGLGLAIAQQIAALLKTKLILFRPKSGKGLGVRLIFE